MNTPKLPPLPDHPEPRVMTWSDLEERAIREYGAACAIAAIEAQGVPDEQRTRNLLARYENQWHRTGELWERCQGKGWPEAESKEFARLRDELTPATRALLLASAPPAPQVDRSGCTAGTDEECTHRQCATKCPKQAALAQQEKEFDDCSKSPTGKHSEEWFANGNCQHCNTGEQNAPLIVNEESSVVQQGPVERQSHGKVVKIVGHGPQYRPDEHDTGVWLEEDGVCVEFEDGYRDCFYVSSLLTPAQQAKPQPLSDPLRDDIQSLLFEINRAIRSGSCPWRIEAAFEAYKAARRL